MARDIRLDGLNRTKDRALAQSPVVYSTPKAPGTAGTATIILTTQQVPSPAVVVSATVNYKAYVSAQAVNRVKLMAAHFPTGKNCVVILPPVQDSEGCSITIDVAAGINSTTPSIMGYYKFMVAAYEGDETGTELTAFYTSTAADGGGPQAGTYKFFCDGVEWRVHKEANLNTYKMTSGTTLLQQAALYSYTTAADVTLALPLGCPVGHEVVINNASANLITLADNGTLEVLLNGTKTLTTGQCGILKKINQYIDSTPANNVGQWVFSRAVS